MKSIICGLTGGICSGKSTIASTFEKHNIPNIDADIIARDVVIPGTIGLQLIIEAFGKQYLNPDGTLNRKDLGSFVFKDSSTINIINHIMMPLIQEEASNRITVLAQQGHAIIVYNAALLCETNNMEKYRPLIVAHCTPEQQLARLMKRGTGHGPLTRQEAMDRISCQMATAEKIKLANFVIDTSQEISYSIKQTETIIKQLQNWNITFNKLVN